jgi:hypothetical protein
MFDLELNNLFSVSGGKGFVFIQIFSGSSENVLLFDLLIKHVLGLGFFILKFGHGSLGSFVLELERVLDLLDLLSFSIELLKFGFLL